MSKLNGKAPYSEAEVRSLIAEADHVVAMFDFDDTLGYREGSKTIISDEGRKMIADFNAHSGNAFIVVTGKAQHQVVEQMTYNTIGPVHIPAVADQFGVKLWPHAPLSADDYVFTVNTDDANFASGRKGIELLNSQAHVDMLNRLQISYLNIEASDLKSCIFLQDHEQNSDRHSRAARELIENHFGEKEGKAVLHALSFQPARTFTDILINGFTEKGETSTNLVNGILETFPKDAKILVLAGGDTCKADGAMMEAVHGLAGEYGDRLKSINFGVGDHIKDQDYVDIGFSGAPKESVRKLVTYFRDVVNPALAKHFATHQGPANANVDRRLMEYFRNAQSARDPSAPAPVPAPKRVVGL